MTRRIIIAALLLRGFAGAAPPPLEPPFLEDLERIVEASPPPEFSWTRARKGRLLKINEILKAHDLSWGQVRLAGKRTIMVKSNSQLQLLPSEIEGGHVGLEVRKGEIHLHSRDDWLGSLFKTPTATIRPGGTQFRLRVEDDGTTTVTMIEGTASVINPHGKVDLQRNEEALVKPGQAPKKRAVINAMNTVQWCLYYPAVIHLPDLGLSEKEHSRLRAPITAYQTGHLVQALDAWPATYRPTSPAAKSFRAMLVLAVGEVDRARAILTEVPENHPGRRAIEELIAAVTYTPDPEVRVNLSVAQTSQIPPHQTDNQDAPRTASEWLARSYYEQSRGGTAALDRALAAASQAHELAPKFGFASVRLAELEFGRGRIRAALQSLEEGMKSTPHNAQGWALRGFLLSSQNRIDEALAAFDTAIEIDGALGNAWLGSGLCKFRLGREEEGRRDLQTAVTLEPNRSLLHSYLGKASSQLGLPEGGLKDLEFAKLLDPNDPTPWLYSALVRQELNRPNSAIRDLQESVTRNDNRKLYRSRYLLDQDRAVRSSNLASIYQYNGMDQLAVREATRAVEANYTDSSAHLFLANSFDALRDPARIELRYETPWFHELILANLLAPVGGGRLSQFVSQQEYSKLLESDGLGANLIGEWRSDSEIRSAVSVFGARGRTSFGIDVLTHHDDGDRRNAEEDRIEVYAQLKHEVTPNDTAYFLAKWQDQESGDTLRYYDNRTRNPDLEFEEGQKPGLLLAGWNHRWGPGSHTLFLGGRLSAEQMLRNPTSSQRLVERDNDGLQPEFLTIVDGDLVYTDPALRHPNPIILGPDNSLVYSPALLRGIDPFLGAGDVLRVSDRDFELSTSRDWEIYSAELQHIQQGRQQTVLAGARLQSGEFDSEANLNPVSRDNSAFFSSPAAKQKVSSDFERITLYAYDYWQAAPWLTLIGGVSWDRVDHPENFRYPPLSDGQQVDEKFSGKLGFTLSPTPAFTMRGLYAEALGGVSFDESVTLEPVHLAGFNQAYRTVISESLVGSVEAPSFTTWGLSMEGRLPTETWWGASFRFIEQDVDRTVGVFTGYNRLPDSPRNPAYFPHGTIEQLDYEETSFQFTVNQLLGDDFAIGGLYRLTQSTLHQRLPDLAGDHLYPADREDEATLQELSLFGNWHSRNGFFGRVEANWFSQDLDDDSQSATLRDGDEFWQLNAFLGYRFNQNQGEVSVGVLNINDSDYRLSPLNPYLDLPRERTAVVRCRFTF